MLVRSVRLSRWLFGAFALMVIGSIAYLPAEAQQPASTRSKVVLQVSDADPAKWNLALNNAKNLQTDLGAANVEVEIVAYGPGIGMLKADSVVGNRIDDMLGKIGYVPAGVVEIMQRQQQGWAYIRP
jgi:intracellular sulfur oxidation DsrE/DsrF family protein